MNVPSPGDFLTRHAARISFDATALAKATRQPVGAVTALLEDRGELDNPILTYRLCQVLGIDYDTFAAVCHAHETAPSVASSRRA